MYYVRCHRDPNESVACIDHYDHACKIAYDTSRDIGGLVEVTDGKCGGKVYRSFLQGWEYWEGDL